MWAAAISPWEWPVTAAGSTPQARQSRRQRDHHREEGRLDELDLLRPALGRGTHGIEQGRVEEGG